MRSWGPKPPHLPCLALFCQALPGLAAPRLATPRLGLFFNNDIVGYQPTIPLALFCLVTPRHAGPSQAALCLALDYSL